MKSLRVARSPSRTARVILPATRSVGMSRRLLATRIAQASAPIPQAAYSPDERDPLGLDVLRAEHRHQPEEHEDHHLAEPEVAVGLRPAGVEPRRSHRHRTHDHQPPGRAGREHQARDRRDPERRERRRLHRARRRDPGADQSHRADPVGVGAADAVGVVVGVVDADLQREAHHESEQGLPPHRVAVVRRHARAREDGRDRGRQRARAGAGHPLRGSRHEDGFKQAGQPSRPCGWPGIARRRGRPDGCRSRRS